MERYQVILAYDGTDFHGSQYQIETRTVQGVFEAALRKLNWLGKSTFFAGRTDTGVHASGQVVAFDLDWNHSPADLSNALNSLLPKDIAVRDISVSPPDFHPRFAATSRSYSYRVYCSPGLHPLHERYAWRVWPAPNFDRLQAASRVFTGSHDFAGFGQATSPDGSTIRHVMASEWWQAVDGSQTGLLIFDITANAFLYHMVRRLVYVSVAVGQGKLEVDDLRQHLHTPPAEPIQGLAPPQGLTLKEVSFPAAKARIK